MNQTLQRLKDIEQNGYQIDFGNIINEAFENYKKIALYAGLVIFVFSILFVIFISGTLIAAMGAQFISEELSPEKFKIENWNETQLLIFNIITIIVTCLLSPFQASFLKMAHCGKLDVEFRITDLFSYYKLPYLTKIIFSTFIISIFSLILTTLFKTIHFEILGIIIAYFISFITILSVPLIIFGDLEIFEAIKYSIVIVFKQPIIILGLVVVSFIGAMVGLMACCIGVLFTIPLFISMNYTIYSSIVGIDIPEEIQ